MKTAHLIALLAPLLVPVACAEAPHEDPHQKAEPNACMACHRAEFESVTHPPHPGVKPMTCGVCHTQESWHPSVLNHAWALTGAHAKVDCFGCHVGAPPVFRGTGNACVDCHRKDAAKVGFAAHATFGAECANCHTTQAWKPATGPAHEEPAPRPEPSATSPSTAKTPPKAPPTKPRPKPVKPPPAPSASTPTKPPDVVTHPSRQLKSD